MENMVNPDFWKGKRVFLTGHTGFKGSWLSLWLQQLGATVTGYALAPATQPNLFDVAAVSDGMTSIIGDIRDLKNLRHALSTSQAEIVLHLAAQALVSEGYRDPIGTYTSNVLGTANLLEAVRNTPTVQSVVMITSDKCYENKEWPWPYRESEPLGGHDPYSSSKACAELITASYRNAYLAKSGISVASARAGNVIGGGDWSPNRLVPDLLAAFSEGHPAHLRRPQSMRPWQHVLEPLAAYLILAERMTTDPSLARAWNFGPDERDCLSTGEIATRLAKVWGGDASWTPEACQFPHEAITLRLDSSLAHTHLGWHPRWTLDAALAATVAWHKAWLNAESMRNVTLSQIKRFNEPADAR
jgi:CDP-glucose 4,6-dehydratase